MIRPLTIATCLLACGSGLYLYQSKHEVQLLDRTIERTVHETNALREQSRLLAAEWTMLNDPERLRQFSDTYLTLKTITPPQFTSLTNLDSRLPSPVTEVPLHGTDEREPVPMAAEAAPQVLPASVSDGVAADEVLPVPPRPAASVPPAVASNARPFDVRIADRAPVPRSTLSESPARSAFMADAHPADQRPSDQRVGEPHVASRSAVDAHPTEQRPTEQRASDQHVAQHVADGHGPDGHGPDGHVPDGRGDPRTTTPPPSRPIVLAARKPVTNNGTPSVGTQGSGAPLGTAPAPARLTAVTSPTPYGGSLLGMAHGPMPPAPRPTPVNATYNTNSAAYNSN